MKPIPKSFSQSMPNKIGKKGEKNLQKHLGGTLTPGSRCGDLKYEDTLIEKKSTEKSSISLKKDYLEKIDRIAFENGKVPILIVEFEVFKKSYCSTQWAILPLEFFKELMELKNNL
jgi:hypothetical protein